MKRKGDRLDDLTRFAANGSAFNRSAPGFGDHVSPHIDHLAAGSHCLGRN